MELLDAGPVASRGILLYTHVLIYREIPHLNPGGFLFHSVKPSCRFVPPSVNAARRRRLETSDNDFAERQVRGPCGACPAR